MNTQETAQVIPEPAWFTSSYSGAEGGQCVEVAVSPGTVQVRDSKDTAGPTLAFSASEWAAFVKFAVQH